MSLFPPRPPPFLFARSAEFIIRLPPPPFASIVLLSTAKIYSGPPSLPSWNLLQSFLSLPFPRLSGGKAAWRLSSDLEGGGGGGDRGRWHREREGKRGGREGRSLCGKRKRNTPPSSLLLQGTLFTTFVSSAYFSISPRIQKPFRGRGFSRGRSGGREGGNTAGPRGKKFSFLGGGENFPTPVHSLILKRGNRVWQSRRRRRPPLLISEAGSTRLVKRRNSKNEEASFLGRLRREKKPRLKMQKAHKGDRGEMPKRTKSREGGRGRTSHGRGKNR